MEKTKVVMIIHPSIEQSVKSLLEEALNSSYPSVETLFYEDERTGLNDISIKKPDLVITNSNDFEDKILSHCQDNKIKALVFTSYFRNESSLHGAKYFHKPGSVLKLISLLGELLK